MESGGSEMPTFSSKRKATEAAIDAPESSLQRRRPTDADATKSSLQQFIAMQDDLRVLYEGTERILRDYQAREASARATIALLEEERSFQKLELERTLPKERKALVLQNHELKEHIRSQDREIARLQNLVSTPDPATGDAPCEDDTEDSVGGQNELTDLHEAHLSQSYKIKSLENELEDSRRMVSRLEVEVKRGQEVLSTVLKASEDKDTEITRLRDRINQLEFEAAAAGTVRQQWNPRN